MKTLVGWDDSAEAELLDSVENVFDPPALAC
jgi:hypothetical protein